MRKYLLSFAACVAILLSSCSNDHLIIDKSYRQKVKSDFNQRKNLADNRKDKLFSVLDNELNATQREALEFLFAYMPLSDLADYSGEFFLANADVALRARVEQKWGRSIPEKIFLHYVLPLRVNNENLDSFRIVYYDEISSRIEGLNAREAALEINHWCHEKVTYQPADIRTSGPMSTILSARGRCGEESTFTVAALRTAGLPARQVYTPRWAHSDDNHAWVEVWIDGSWFYSGACEPEPVLDRGWFTEPARRAMLVHTKSFGAPSGENNIITSGRNFSIINNLSKYATTKRIFVRVLNKESETIQNARVEYQLYNYAEFYPLAVVPTDKNGISSFETGLGDLMIWAHNGADFNYSKISVNEIDTLTLVLDRKPAPEGYFEYDLGVPVTRTPLPGPSEEVIKANSERLDYGNKKRESYIDTWMKPDEATELAKSLELDTTVIKDFIMRSMGNFEAVASFLKNSTPENRALAVKLLTLVADKDLRDTPERIFADHLNNTLRYENSGSSYDTETFYNYVLNPRVANELIVAWRKYLFDNADVGLRQQAIDDPSLLIDYVNKRISVNDSENYYMTPITPVGVDQLKVADRFSRDIYFVALCRALGIPSRLEKGSNRPQYFRKNKWHDVYFADEEYIQTEKGYLKIFSKEIQPVPEYYIHFTIARFENGRYNTLEYDINRRIDNFGKELELLPGHYMLVTGNRINDSKILSSVTFFELLGNEHKTIEVVLRKDESPLKVLGKLDIKSEITLSDGSKKRLEDLTGNGLVLTWIEPDKEPTKHIFNDLPLMKTEIDKWGGWFVFLLPPSEGTNEFNPAGLTGLPAKSIFVSDTDSELFQKICGALSCSSARLPFMIIVNDEGEIVFRSEGYTIGIGEQIIKTAQ